MEAGPGPAPGGGGAAIQVVQVGSLGSGVSQVAQGGDCTLARRGREKRALGPRIQLWEVGFGSQTLPRRKAMEGEGIRNFKELRAKFQKLDAPLLPRPIEFPAGGSQKDDTGSTRPTGILASGKPLSFKQNQSLTFCSSGNSEPLKSQTMKLAHWSEIQKYSNSPGPLEKSTVCSVVDSCKASLLLDGTHSNAEITDHEKEIMASSFRDKLWNWEKVSSQKSEMSSALLLANCGSKAFHLKGNKGMGLTQEESRKKLQRREAQTLPSQRHLSQRKLFAASEDPAFVLSQHGKKSEESPSPDRSPTGSICQPIYEYELASQAPEKQSDVRHHQLPKTKPMPSIESLGPPPPKPSKPPAVNLQAFREQQAALAETHRRATARESYPSPESAEFEEPHNYEATISYQRHSGNSINLCTAKEIADSTYKVEIEELRKPWKSFLHREPSPKCEDDGKKMKEEEPFELDTGKTEKDPHSNHPFKVVAYQGTPQKIQMATVHRERKNMLAENQDALTDINQMKACPKGTKLTEHSQGPGTYVEALEMSQETPDTGALKPSSISEETYDDVEYPMRETPKLEFSDSFASDSEENSEKIYEDVYKTKSNHPKIDLDGKKALKRLQRFFKKEKDRFKMKKTKSKENVSAFSISLPDLQLRSQEVTIYDDVDMSEKESKDEDKVKTWKPKFLIPKEKKEKKGAEGSDSLSPRNFFRTKKQNLEKNRMEKEEKLFRERFEYDKEIIVINTAVACSNNSRNGTFDLPITPGEVLEVIDTTEQNLVLCRNSKGKYGYVLVEHLNFKHQDWSS